MKLSSSAEPSRRTGLIGWLDERIGIGGAIDFLRDKTVPGGAHAAWYYFGGVSLFLFGIQVATGLLLLFYYKPGTETAYRSVQFTVTRVPFGWLMRSLHAWSANLMVFAVFVHMFSVYFHESLSTAARADLADGHGAVGVDDGLRLLWGTSCRGTSWLSSPPKSAPTSSPSCRSSVRCAARLSCAAATTWTDATLTRFFGFHVAILPAAFSGSCCSCTWSLIPAPGNERVDPGTPDPATQGGCRSIPGFIIRDAILWLGVLALLLVGCVTFLPWELGVQADPFAAAPAGIRPEWYFAFVSQSLKYLPARIFGIDGEVVGICAFLVGAGFLVLAPFLDRRAARGARSPVFTFIGVAIIIYMVTMVTLAFVKPY